MDPKKEMPVGGRALRGNVPHGFRDLLFDVLSQANQTHSQPDLLRHICGALLRFSGAEALHIQVEDEGKVMGCRALRHDDGATQIQIHVPPDTAPGHEACRTIGDLIPESILTAILTGSFAAPTQSFTRGRSFWTGDTALPILLHDPDHAEPTGRTIIIGGEYTSLALILIPMRGHARGVLFLASRKRDFFSRDDVQLYEVIAATLGVALVHQRTQWALRERVKELTCLYGIERIASRPGTHLKEILPEIVDLLPPGWQYPEITAARILLEKYCYATAGFRESPYQQSAEIIVDGRPRGKVEVYYTEKRPDIDEGPFLAEERNLINAVAETISRLAAHNEAQWALRERIKELTCLYGISTAASRPHILVDDFLKEVVELLPPGWQYPECTQACITLDGKVHATARYGDSPYRQKADILVNDQIRGLVEVIYTEEKPEFAEGPFLREERHLIDEVARQVGFIVEYWEAERETNRLQEQLRHAERLATVGQLSAGIAHELNEPLAAILGFAELVKESPGMPTPAIRDVEKIMNAALHAREVIRKLMIFTRQLPTKKERCDLNLIIREGLYFLESRCAKENISLIRRLEKDLPPITADTSQLHQVLVNLVVNGIQAMPKGGTLTISTRLGDGVVCFAVEDTGVGMSHEVQKQVFIPFFTTKDVGQGTGLGLAVVHGIVTAHGGSIEVKSEVGQGSVFEVCLPIDSSALSKE
jgi:signal transduction histidine kinase